MFNLEKAIDNWKEELRRSPAFEDGDIAELESHLREEIGRLQSEGHSEEEAFRQAAAEIGEPERLGDELYRSRAPQSAGSIPSWKQKSWMPALFPGYVRVAMRNIRKSPVYSLINISGLALGIACCMLIVIYLQYQFSFDTFHSDGDRIFRVNKVVTPTTGGTELHAITSGPMGPQMKADYPEVREAVRLLPWFDDVLLSREESILKVDRFVLADSAFFGVFDFELLQGNPATALADPLSIVISEQVARHFFGEENPVGRSLEGLNGYDYTVTGVIENTPHNSHLQYDALVSWSSTAPSALNFGWLENWFPQSIYTYLLLEKLGDEELVEAKFSDFIQRHFPQMADQYELYLQPVPEIYLRSSSMYHDDTVLTGSITNVYIFSAVAVLVLLIACINFMNLATARSLDRAREVGVRKVLGATRNQLGWQFLGEAVVLSLVATVVALGLIWAGLPILNYLGLPDEMLMLQNHMDLVFVLVGIALLTGLISGSYPALVLSAFRPVRVLKGKAGKSAGADVLLRKSLVTFQFSLSIMLIIGTLVIQRQMEFVNEKDLGFREEQVLVLQMGGTDIYGQAGIFKQELLKHSGILEATHTNSVPGSSFAGYTIIPENTQPDERWTSNIMRLGDDDLLQTFGMEMAAGRFFNSDLASDSSAVVINEALARSLAWENPVGRGIDVQGELAGGRVIGVIRDFHTASLHTNVEPLLLYIDDRGSFLSLRLDPSQLSETLDYIGETWNRFDPEYPFEYSFVDDQFASFYQSVYKTLDVVSLFTGLAIFVACLGLFGLSTFMVNQRTKEIGIRKILGSSVRDIVLLVSRDFLLLVGAGFLLAVPAAWWLAGQWLQDFAYQVEIGIGVFLIAGAAALALACLAVFWQSIRAAYLNPVESLRSE